MLKTSILPGDTAANEARWRNDSLLDVYDDDALWGFMIRASEELPQFTGARVRDPVLSRLLRMGVYDWTGENVRTVASTQAMRHSTAMATRLLARLLEVEEKVRR